MKQRNLLSENDNARSRKDYNTPLQRVMQIPKEDAIRTSEPSGTPIEWDSDWENYL